MLREPPRTRLSARVGSYSQMAVAFLTAAIFVMWLITSTFPRLTTCPKQLQRNSIGENRNKWTKHMVAVVHHCSIQGLGGCEYPGLFCKLCCYFPCYLMLPCKADKRSRMSGLIIMAGSMISNKPLFQFCPWSQHGWANPRNTFRSSHHYVHLTTPWTQ